MGSLFLQLGQAGNQIGLQLMEYMDMSAPMYAESYLKRSDQNVLHSIMIDTEPKTVRPVIENRKRYPFIDTKNVLHFQHGRGNNWALGYMDNKLLAKVKSKKPFRPDRAQMKALLTKGGGKFSEKPAQLIDLPTLVNNNYQTMHSDDGGEPSVPASAYLKENEQILEQVIQMLRKEIERVDYFVGLNMIYSLGGGTGSGLGSRLIEEFRDTFSDISLINTVIFPNRDGETTLQHYNCLLSLAHLQTYSDCVIYFENDKINDYLNYTRSKSIDKVVDLSNINQFIASHLLNMVRINDFQSYERFYFDLLLDTAPMDEFKFVELYSTPYYYEKTASTGPESSWERCCDVLCHQVNVPKSYMTESHKLEEERTPAEDVAQKLQELNQGQRSDKHVSIAVNTIFRSADVTKTLSSQDKVMHSVEKRLMQTFNPVRWNPDCLHYEHVEEGLKNVVDSKLMLCMANRSCIADLVQDISATAYNKYKANAFLHWYYKYGIERGDFENAFLIADNIVENYESLKLQ